MNHVDVDYDFPQTSLVMAPDADGSSKNAVDVVRQFSADVLAVGPPPGVEILGPDSRGTVCGGEFGEFCAQICTKDHGVAGSAVDIGYTRDSSPRHAQVNKVVEKRDGAGQLPPRIRAMPTRPGVPDPGGTLKLEHSPEPGGTSER